MTYRHRVLDDELDLLLGGLPAVAIDAGRERLAAVNMPFAESSMGRCPPSARAN